MPYYCTHGFGGRGIHILWLAELFAAAGLLATPLYAASCEKLKELPVADTVITLAQSVAAAKFELPDGILPEGTAAKARQAFGKLPAFCRVAATIRPTKDSDIKIEVWMPISGWNGRFMGLGNGGWGGSIAYPALFTALGQGFAAASTDTGHTGKSGDASFALGHPEKLIDFGYRSVHLMSMNAKTIIANFYGKPIRYSYWDGCSTGGKQALTEAQRYPDDYDGIVAGAPANFFTHLMFGNIWPAIATLKDPAANIPDEKYAVIHQAVMKACDALDGVEDGIINDPEQCHFNPETLACKGPDGPECLTPPQVRAVRQIYAGVKNSRTGEQIFPGLEPGSPLEQATGAPPDHPLNFFRYVLFRNPDWKWQTLNFDSDVTLADQTAAVLNATDPDLKAFQAHGGKLILYHGWSDPHISPMNTVNYYESVVTAVGGAAPTDDFVRLFMVPNMGHCQGGTGPDEFDKIGAIEEWVEHHVAPDKIIASHQTRDGVTDMTRPLCPYPQVANWKGSGSTNEAANFTCVHSAK
jgi:tannase/feruloyl esterase